ncbi:c2 domain-containing protein [Anaeramoeba flamelloides]|uniref:C2 domain-containing protein n=1 Tax=Anaeramoeba flamelloides TaxID=1746091 RepID=A0AAV7YPE9_9EUKA|nr:c2 domain-containing protein [Anaeramoeba flamelloides]
MNNIYVKVIEAQDIHGADLGGKSDPYCTLKINDEDINKKKLKNKVSKDDSIGMCKIPLSTFVNGQPHDGWYDIKPMKKEKAKGKLHLLFHYCPVGVPFVRRDF